jgi:uncharacterized protein YukE
MSLITPWTDLSNNLKNIRQAWEHIQDLWNDPVRQEFEQQHWLPMDEQVTETLRALDRLAQTVAQMKRECSEEEQFFV